MKKVIKSLIISLMVVCLTVGIGFTGQGNGPGGGSGGGGGQPQPDSFTTVSTDFYVGSQPSFYGQTYHAGHLEATGKKDAFVTYDGFSTICPEQFTFTNADVAGGKLSGSLGITTGFSTVTGIATGVDETGMSALFAGFKKDGPDEAFVGLEVGGVVRQYNGGMFFDATDKDTFAWGGNDSTTTWSAFSSDYSDGKFDLGRCGSINSPIAFAADSLTTTGVAIGGTLAFAKQTKDEAIAGTITGNTGSAWTNGYGLDGTVFGLGSYGGLAVLPGVGDAGYRGDFNYFGGLDSYGLGGGLSVVKEDKAFTTSFVTTKSNEVTFENYMQDVQKTNCGGSKFTPATGYGSTSGGVSLVGQGGASYSAMYTYSSPTTMTGIAGGTATIENVGQYGVKSSASAYSSVSTGGDQDPR